MAKIKVFDSEVESDDVEALQYRINPILEDRPHAEILMVLAYVLANIFIDVEDQETFDHIMLEFKITIINIWKSAKEGSH
jgi:hypothetical protein